MQTKISVTFFFLFPSIEEAEEEGGRGRGRRRREGKGEGKKYEAKLQMAVYLSENVPSMKISSSCS